jgi:hypothetical protein
MPHAKGEIKVDLQQTAGNRLVADIELPPGISGDFVYHGLYRALTPGANHLEVKF